MVDGNDVKRKSGAVTVLALLVSFLFGYAPVQAAPDSNSARLGPAELVKRGAPLRSSVRTSQSDDQDESTAVVPPAPVVLTEILGSRPAAAGSTPARTAAPQAAPHAYRARAPPAA